MRVDTGAQAFLLAVSMLSVADSEARFAHAIQVVDLLSSPEAHNLEDEMKTCASVLIIGFAVCFACQPDEVRVKRLVLVDGEDRERAVLETDSGVVILSLYDQADTRRVSLVSGNGTDALVITDKNGEDRISLGLAEGVGPVLTLEDAEGRMRAVMSGADENPLVAVSSDFASGKGGTVGMVFDDDAPALVVRDKVGTLRAALGLDYKHETAGIFLRDEAGQNTWSEP